jgi:hypothetical protein
MLICTDAVVVNFTSAHKASADAAPHAFFKGYITGNSVLFCACGDGFEHGCGTASIYNIILCADFSKHIGYKTLFPDAAVIARYIHIRTAFLKILRQYGVVATLKPKDGIGFAAKRFRGFQ